MLSDEKQVFLEGWGTKKPISLFCCERRRYFKFYTQSGQFKIDYYKTKDPSTFRGTFEPEDKYYKINNMDIDYARTIIMNPNPSYENSYGGFWFCFIDKSNRILKIKLDEELYAIFDRKEFNLTNRYIDTQRTFTFNKDIESDIYKWKSVPSDHTSMSETQRSGRFLKKEKTNFNASRSIEGKLGYHITKYDTGNTQDLNKDSFLFSYLNEALNEFVFIKYEDLKDYGTFIPPFDPTISPKEVFLEGWGIKKAIRRFGYDKQRYFKFYR